MENLSDVVRVEHWLLAQASLAYHHLYHKLMKDLVKIIHEASSGLSRFASPGYQILYFYVRILVVPVLTDVSKEDE